MLNNSVVGFYDNFALIFLKFGQQGNYMTLKFYSRLILQTCWCLLARKPSSAQTWYCRKLDCPANILSPNLFEYLHSFLHSCLQNPGRKI